MLDFISFSQIGRERIQMVLELGGPNLEEHWLDLGGPESVHKLSWNIFK